MLSFENSGRYVFHKLQDVSCTLEVLCCSRRPLIAIMKGSSQKAQVPVSWCLDEKQAAVVAVRVLKKIAEDCQLKS